jgi:23S rRNA (uracil1939-C5)-methyltransferase
MHSKNSPETIETRIESLAAGGDGVGRTPDGRALFVPLTAPRDRVRVRIVESRSRFARGELEAVIEPSPDRVEPACAVFGRCGGCAWQHLDYPAQLSAKAQILRDALTRIGRLEVEEEIRVVPSPSAYGYRSRARPVQVGSAVGFRMRGSRRVCAVDACPVLQPPLEAELQRLVAKAASGRSSSSEEVEWELAAGTDAELRATRISVASQGAPRRENIHLAVAGDRLRISTGVFAQANALLLAELSEAVCREADRGITAVELFAGAGLLTLPLSRRFDCVWALESDPRAIADLRFNLEMAGRPNVDVRKGRVERNLSRLGLRSPDALVLDPPRTGLPRPALDALLNIRPRRVVYLSCDPATLSRDLARLCDDGYRLARIQAFDLFPQTPHVEALATLVPTRAEASR